MGKLAHELLDDTQAWLNGLGGQVGEFLTGTDWEMEARALEPTTLDCLRHLDRCAALAEGTPGADVARLLAERGHRLHWGQTWTAADFGQKFVDNYGWMELFGTRGHFASARLACGFLLLGPGLHYPDHHHEAEELYVPLTGGALWRQGGGYFAPRAAGEVIHHRSNEAHAIKTQDTPLLALYLWRGGPLAARSTVTGAAG